jgi:integrase
MAHIKQRPRKNGITYTVRWIDATLGKEQTENFAEETEADVFLALVTTAGQRWPAGWIRGEGFAPPPPTEADDVPLMDWILRYIERLNGIEERTRHDYTRSAERHFRTVFPETMTVKTLKKDDVQDWVRAEEKGLRDPNDPKGEAWTRSPVGPKTIANNHGLLYSAMQAALEAEPPLRSTNPCSKTKLPRTDDGDQDEMCFLEHDEYQRLRAELEKICDGDAVDLADFLVGLGLRWGEITALQVQDVKLAGTKPTLSVARAWKRQDDNTFKLGPPKTTKARRTLALTPEQVTTLRRLVAGKQPDGYVFLTTKGKVWRHSNFYYRRWVPAVAAAMAKGLPRKPRPHDLRHTHVSWLIAANVAPSAIQARVGHESIKTTMDRYGHLMRAHDDEIVAAITSAMSVQAAPGLRLVAAAVAD